MTFRKLASATVLCALVFSGSAHASLTWSWAFGAAPAVVRPTDTVHISATITNDASSTEHLDFHGAQYSGQMSLIWYRFDSGYGEEMFDLDLAPGESLEFNFGTMTPIGAVSPGVYGLLRGTGTTWFSDGISICGGAVSGPPYCEGVFTQPLNDFLFTVSDAVPEPGSVTLVLGALGLMAATTRRRRK